MSALPTPPDRGRPAARWIFAGLAVAAWMAGAWGFWLYEAEHTGEGHWLDAMYHATQLFVLHAPPLKPPVNGLLEGARWLSVLVVAWAAIVATARIFGRDLTLLRLRFTAARHAVIVGPAGRAVEMARCLRRRNARQTIAVVVPSADEEVVRACHAIGVWLVVGPTAISLPLVRLGRAERLIALFENDQENVDVVARACQICRADRPRGARLVCEAQVADVDMREGLRRHSFAGADTGCDVRFFDFFEEIARDLLLTKLPLDREGVRAGDPRRVHLVVVGFGTVGRTVAVKAAQLGHFVNGTRLCISVIDEHAKERERDFRFRYPTIDAVCDITFIELPIRSADAQHQLAAWGRDAKMLTSVAVCLDNDGLAFDLSMRMLADLRRAGVPVAVRFSRPEGVASLLASAGTAGIRAFGWFDAEACERLLESDTREKMARLAHAGFVELARQQGRRPEQEESVRAWNDVTTEDFKESNRQQVDHIAIKLRAVGLEEVPRDDPRPAAAFSDAERELLAKVEHTRWNAERRLAGWTFGPKNVSARTNPNIVEWSELADDIRKYDFDAIDAIPLILERMRGTKLCRTASGGT